MKTGDYRREYAAYTAALERARHHYHTGVEPKLRLAPLRDRYADLWTRAAIDDLIRAREETSGQFETERIACAALLRAAQFGYAEARAAEVTGELARCMAAARFECGGLTFTAEDGQAVLAATPDATHRRELAARWFDSLRACDDLRVARLDTLHETTHDFGCDSYFDFLSEVTETAFASLVAEADGFLERTAPTYNAKLFAWSARHLPPDLARQPTYGDSLFFARLPDLERFFHGGDVRTTYDATMRGLGIRPAQQLNLRVEATADVLPQRSPARCFALSPPEDVRLVYDETSGANFYQTFFEAAGRAQHFAWVSRDLAARYPELVHAPHETTRAGFAFLFGDLHADATWITERRNVRPAEALEIARSVALVGLHRTRRACVQLRHQSALENTSDARSEQLAASYAAALEEATGFSAHPALHLYDLIPDGLSEAHAEGAALPPAVYLRARLFAAALAEYFRTRHGRRWWSTRKAGDELIDMWNTGSRYTVEELASLADLGPLNFDLLAESAVATLKHE